ncbi:hypothetical protein [uncultured Sphaerotilus sp.]|uniref:hypothetical protein n=1 Tax=uncultured Sphaerotilus sp. TaxID=474984 RepID=UPI0030CA4C3C
MLQHKPQATEDELLRAELLQVTELDLGEFADAVPPGAGEVVRVLGVALAVKVFNAWPGVFLRVPAAQSNRVDGQRRRAELLRVLDQAELLQLCTAWGGEPLRVPVLRSLLSAKRQRWLRTTHDALTSGHPPAVSSKAEAIYVMGMRLAAAGMAMTSHQIEMVLDSPEPGADDRQRPLFAAT